MTLPLLQVPTMEQDVQHKGIWLRERAGSSGLGGRTFVWNPTGSASRPGLEGAVPRLGSFLILCGDGVSLGQHVEIGDRSRCLCCTELPSQFPGHFAGAGQGDPSRSHMEDNPNSAEHVDWVSVDFQSGCRRTMAL